MLTILDHEGRPVPLAEAKRRYPFLTNGLFRVRARLACGSVGVSEYATEGEAWAARDALLDAGAPCVKVEGLPATGYASPLADGPEVKLAPG